MIAPHRAGAPNSVRPIEVRPRGRPLRLSVVLGVLGLLELALLYWALGPRLPSQVPWQFAPNGQAIATLPPGAALGVDLAALLAVSSAFTMALWWGSRSVPLATQFRGQLIRPLLLLQGILVVGVLPLADGLELASAAGVLGLAGPNLGLLLNALGVLVALTVIVGSIALTARLVPTLPDSPSAGPIAHPPFAVGGPIELGCSACGEPFRLSGVPIFVVRVGVGRFGSLYLRCPRCGERGWDKILGRVAS